MGVFLFVFGGVVLAAPRDLLDLSSLTRGQTHPPCGGNLES